MTIWTIRISPGKLSEFANVNIAGWWFGTFFIFPYIGNIHPNWLSYFSEGLKPPTSRVWECEHRRCKKKGMFTGGYFRYGIHCWVSQQPRINWAPTISLCLAGRPIYHGFMALFWDVLSGKFLCASFFAKLEIPEDLFFPPHFPSCSIIFPHFPQIFPRFSPGFPTFCGSAGWHATRMPWPWAPATSAASMMRRPSPRMSLSGVKECWTN